MRENDDYRLWLCSIPGIFTPQRSALLQYFGTDEAVYNAPDAELLSWKRLGCGWIDKVIRAKEHSPERCRNILSENGTGFVSREDPAFPKGLKDLPDCPYGIFYRGFLPDPDEKCAAIVGSRSCSVYGRKIAQTLSRELTDYGISIVSGMAVGIDGTAQIAALDAGGRSYAVLGCGTNLCYPPEHIDLYERLAAEGGIFSELPCDAQPLRFHFPMRNRLIAALCEVLIVVEAREKSGSLITADLALDLGRDIYAVPGRSMDPLSLGCNRLIAQGAGIFTGIPDFLKELSEKGLIEKEKTGSRGGQSAKNEDEPEDARKQSVLSVLEKEPQSVERIALRCSILPYIVHGILLELQLSGKVEEAGRGYYYLV